MSKLIKLFFSIGDIILLNSIILLSHYFYHAHLSSSVVYLVIYSNLTWLFLILVSSPYHIEREWSISKILKHQMAFLLIHLLVILSLNLFFKKNYGAVQIGLIYLLFIPLFFLWKIVIFYLRKFLFKKTASCNYILVGRNSFSYQLREYYMMYTEEGRKFCGYFDYTPGTFSITQMRDFCLKRDVHEIYCCLPNVEKSELSQLVDFSLNSLITVKLILPISVSQEESIRLDHDVTKPVLEAIATPLDNPVNQFIKRIFDFVFSSFVVAFILSWLIPLLGLMIVLESPGPILFWQKRNGRGNKIFYCLKFRTMRKNVDADSKVATRYDSRITRLGNFCRRTSIDELPQFINVLMGSMSVVGPRPHMLQFRMDYAKLIDRFTGRHYVKPGITGLAQCLGYRGQKSRDVITNLPDIKNRVKMDFYYIENWSFVFDMKIIFLTVLSLLKRSGRGA